MSYIALTFGSGDICRIALKAVNITEVLVGLNEFYQSFFFKCSILTADIRKQPQISLESI